MWTLMISPRKPEWSAWMTVLVGAAAAAVCYVSAWGIASGLRWWMIEAARVPMWMEWALISTPLVIPAIAGGAAAVWAAVLLADARQRVAHAAIALGFCVPAAALGYLAAEWQRWGDIAPQESAYALIAMLVLCGLMLGLGWVVLSIARLLVRTQEVGEDSCRVCGYVWGRADVERCWECEAPAAARRWYQGRTQWMRRVGAESPGGLRILASLVVIAWLMFLLQPLVFPQRFFRAFDGVGRYMPGHKFDRNGYASQPTPLFVMFPADPHGYLVGVAYGRRRSGSPEWMQVQLWQTGALPPAVVVGRGAVLSYGFGGVVCDVPPGRIAEVMRDGLPERLVSDVLAAGPAPVAPFTATPLRELDAAMYWPK